MMCLLILRWYILCIWGRGYKAEISCFTTFVARRMALSQTAPCPWSVRMPSSHGVLPRKVNLTSNQHLQPPHPAMCPSETSKVVPSLHSQRDLRERRDFNQSSTNMKLFSLLEHFITWAAPVGPHVSLNCRIAFFLQSTREQLYTSPLAYNVYLESLHLILDLPSRCTKRWEYCRGHSALSNI